MNRYFLVIEEDMERKSIMSERQLMEFLIPFAALLNEHRSIEDRIDVTDIDAALIELSRLVFLRILELAEVKNTTITWLQDYQLKGEFEGLTENYLDFTEISDNEIDWYFSNWLMKKDEFIASLTEDYQFV